MDRNLEGPSTALPLYQPRNDAGSYDDTGIGKSIFIAGNVHVRPKVLLSVLVLLIHGRSDIFENKTLVVFVHEL
jgi:hypothetical protein